MTALVRWLVGSLGESGERGVILQGVLIATVKVRNREIEEGREWEAYWRGIETVREAAKETARRDFRMVSCIVDRGSGVWGRLRVAR